ncbi:MAG: PD-(D/E)XK nuclease family protein, partial [Pseudomonadales bacterium]|nr:PD-(D/E)XK nuclease family protein [Pseudomonadales bacterium]
KKRVWITYPRQTTSDTGITLRQPSQFAVLLQEKPELSDYSEIEADGEKLLPLLEAKLNQPILDIARIKAAEKAYLKKLLENFVLSPTTLNRYLKNPDDFLHQDLLHAPQAEDENGYLAFGVAIHRVLEELYKAKLTGQPLPDFEMIENIFWRKLKSANLANDVEQAWRKLGLDNLERLYQNAQHDQGHIFGLEKNFGQAVPVLCDGVAIKGKIDRLDLLTDDTLVVTDYKTGRAKSDNAIRKIGSGASEREQALPPNLQSEYIRQLLFYKILVENDPQNKYSVSLGQLNFVIERESGKAVVRKVVFNDEDVLTMKNLIKQVDGEIRNLEFLNT